MNTIRRAALGVAAVLAAVPAVMSAAAAAPASATVWTLLLDGGEKQCRLTLRPEAAGHGASVAMPPGCHRAFPALAGVTTWSEFGEGLHFDDARGDTLLAFDADGKGFRTTSPQGERLILTSADGKGRDALDKEAAAVSDKTGPAPGIAQGETAKPVAAVKKVNAASEKPAEVAGRFAVLRDKTRDTGCMVTLDDKARGPGVTLKARLAPACRDQGIVIFDPIGWQMEAGKLVLTARKGHTTALDHQEDGTWMNEPKKGKALSLKRI
ncbi:MAG: AprI/Inh family metalloprotease inhibitor [Janthinobacterium lividum]